MNKRRILRNVLIGISSLIVCLLLLAIIVVNTAAFHDFLCSEIRKQTLNRMGARVEIGSIETHWLHLVVDLSNVVVYGSETSSANEPPLLRASRLEVRLRFLPLLRGRFELSDLALDQPVVRIRIDSQGRNNLPVATGASSNSGPDAIFDLEIGNCTIRSGEIDYNDAQIPLGAELHNVKFAGGRGVLDAEYKGSFSYDNGRLSAPQFEPIAHAMQLQFTAARSGLSLSPIQITTTGSRIVVNLQLTNYVSPGIDGTYEGNVLTNELARIMRLRALPEGNVALDGKFAYRPNQQRSFLAAIYVKGQASSGRLQIRTSLQPIDATRVGGNYELKDATLHVQNLAATLLGGSAEANWQMQNMDTPNALSDFEASLKGLSLATASDALAPRKAQRIPFVGRADLDVRANWSGSVRNAVVHARLLISNRQQEISSQSIPVNGLVQFDYSAPHNTLAFSQSYLQTSNTKLAINGTVNPRRAGNSVLNVEASTSDLREVTSLAAMMQTAPQTSQLIANIPNLGGSATVNARVTGTAKDPRVQARFDAQNLTINESHWQSLAVNLSANSSELAVQNGALQASGNEEINFSGRAELQNWSLAATSPIELHASGANISVATAEEISRLRYPVSGTLSAKVSINGTRAALNGTAAVTLARGSAWNEAIDSIALNAEFRQGAIRSSLKLQIPAGTISGDADYSPATQRYDVNLHGKSIQLDKIAALQKGTAVQGALDLSLAGSGTIDKPELEANLAVPQLQTSGRKISNIAAKVGLANQHASVEVHTIVDQGSAEAKGDVALTGDRYTTATLDFYALPVAAIAADFFPAQASKLGGQTEIHLELKGPLKSPAQIEAHLEIPSLGVTYSKAQLALASPLRADYRNGALTLMPAQILGTGTKLTFAGTIPIQSEAASSLIADGSVDLSLLQQFVPDLRSSGQVQIHIHSGGHFSQENIQGQLEVKNAILSTQSLPVGIEGLNAKINLSGNRAEIANLSGTAGGGIISATGFVDLMRYPNFNLTGNAQSVRIRYPKGLRSILSGQINLQGSPKDSTLSGHAVVNSLSFTQEFDLANFAGYFSQDSASTPPSALASNMKLNVAVQSAQDLDLKSSKLSLGGSANFNVTGTLAQPVVLGRVGLNSGEVFFLGKRFEVQNGSIQFANPVRTDPVLNMHVSTTVEQYNVTLNMAGPVDRLVVNYTSEPALPSADIIHLLALGNTTTEAASAPSQSAAMGAESVLAQGVSGQVTGKLENLTGISQLTIDPLATNSQGDPGAQVAIQERVTGSLLLTFSSNVTSTQSQTVQLHYSFNKGLSVTVLRDQNGGYGLDLRVHKVF